MAALPGSACFIQKSPSIFTPLWMKLPLFTGYLIETRYVNTKMRLFHQFCYGVERQTTIEKADMLLIWPKAFSDRKKGAARMK